MKNLQVFIVSVIMLITHVSLGQEKTVTGIVCDASLPLPGVSVTMKEIKKGTSTNFTGNYSIAIKKGQTLVFDFMGYQQQSVKVGNDTVINVILKEGQKVNTHLQGSHPGINLGYTSPQVTNTNGKNYDNNPEQMQHLTGNGLNIFLENLKTEILNDTLKFNKKHLNLDGLIKNQHEYSRLYIVNMSYFYKLDIVDNKKVKGFVNEILNAKKIASIYICEKKACNLLFGKIGFINCVFIETKKESKVKYKVAGLKFGKKRKGGFNFFK